MKGTVLESILSEIAQHSNNTSVDVSTATKTITFNITEDEWAVSTDTGILQVTNDEGTTWIDCEAIIEVHI